MSSEMEQRIWLCYIKLLFRAHKAIFYWLTLKVHVNLCTTTVNILSCSSKLFLSDLKILEACAISQKGLLSCFSFCLRVWSFLLHSLVVSELLLVMEKVLGQYLSWWNPPPPPPPHQKSCYFRTVNSQNVYSINFFVQFLPDDDEAASMFNVVIDKDNAQNDKKKKASSAGSCIKALSHQFVGFDYLCQV